MIMNSEIPPKEWGSESSDVARGKAWWADTSDIDGNLLEELVSVIKNTKSENTLNDITLWFTSDEEDTTFTSLPMSCGSTDQLAMM
jgi:hypothetical protein